MDAGKATYRFVAGVVGGMLAFGELVPLSSAAQITPAREVALARETHASALAGEVRDSLGHPIAYANVYVDGGVTTTANESGRFLLDDVPIGRTRFRVRRVGYGPLTFMLMMPEDTTVLVSIHMHRVVQRLREVTVEEKMASTALARAGFYERAKAGIGFFLFPMDIEARAPRRVEDLVDGVSGVTILRVDGHPAAFGTSPKGYCRLSVVLDGRRYRLDGQDELLIEPRDLKAVEIYPLATDAPAEFHDPDNPLCGVIVLWTKVD